MPDRWGVIVSIFPPIADIGAEHVGPFASLEAARAYTATLGNATIWTASIVFPPLDADREATR